VAHFAVDDDRASLETIRELLSYMPSNNLEEPPLLRGEDPPGREDAALDELIPAEANKPYDMKRLIAGVVDDARFLEVHAHYAPNIVVGFARLGGRSVGLVANQPAVLAGCLDIDASVKGARFVRFCDAFNIPLVVFEDVPGFLPGTAQEWGGIIRHGAKLLYAFAEATVPKLTVITRKAYGGAYCVMASKHIRADLNFAYPTAEIAVMGPEGAVNVLYRRELQNAADPERLRAEKVAEFREKFANPYVAAERGFVDEVIEPRQTRRKLIAGLEMARTKRDRNPPKKHGNIPL
jgi:propionyl-CoA carboxylase beta chain